MFDIGQKIVVELEMAILIFQEKMGWFLNYWYIANIGWERKKISTFWKKYKINSQLIERRKYVAIKLHANPTPQYLFSSTEIMMEEFKDGLSWGIGNAPFQQYLKFGSTRSKNITILPIGWRDV